MENQIEETGTIPMTVSSAVVKYFSEGLYQNFGRAIKELISNSYDAEATEVKIRLDLLGGRILVRDNGKGMDVSDLKENFLKIGYPTPTAEDKDALGRKRIGKFGIGAVAIFPYCEKITVLTKKRNSKRNIELKINSQKFFDEEAFVLNENAEQAEFPYVVTKSDLPFEKGETIVILEELKPHILNDLRREKGRKGISLEKFSGFEKFKWTLGQYCPLQFPSTFKELRDFFEDKEKVAMRLWLDGEEIFRNVPEGARILEKDEVNFGQIRVKFAIMSPFAPVRPEEAKGLQIRLRDVGIGLPRDFDIIQLTGHLPGKLNWICGEVHILEGLNDSLMIDRDSFSYTREVAQLESFFRKKLARWDDFLQDKALEDKEIYETVQGIKGSSELIKSLKDAEILEISKERLRIPKKPITKSKRRRKKSASPVLKIKNVLSKDKKLQVESRKTDFHEEKPPIEVSNDKKKVVIYENHG